MSEEEEPDEETAKKGGKGGLILAVVALILGGGAGFAAQRAGLVGSSGAEHESAHEEPADPVLEALPPAEIGEFVTLAPLLVNLTGEGERRHIRMAVVLEVDPHAVKEVELVMPRIMDVMNSYLRVMEFKDLEDRHVLSRIKRHLHTRIELVLGPDRLRSVLVQEFVVN